MLVSYSCLILDYFVGRLGKDVYLIDHVVHCCLLYVLLYGKTKSKKWEKEYNAVS